MILLHYHTKLALKKLYHYAHCSHFYFRLSTTVVSPFETLMDLCRICCSYLCFLSRTLNLSHALIILLLLFYLIQCLFGIH